MPVLPGFTVRIRTGTPLRIETVRAMPGRDRARERERLERPPNLVAGMAVAFKYQFLKPKHLKEN